MRRLTLTAAIPMFGLALALALSAPGCGSTKAPLTPEQIDALAQEVLVANREEAEKCQALAKEADEAFDEGLDMDGDGMGRQIAAGRQGKIGAVSCFTTWMGSTMRQMSDAGVPGEDAKRIVQRYLIEDLGAAAAMPVF